MEEPLKDPSDAGLAFMDVVFLLLSILPRAPALSDKVLIVDACKV